MLHGNLSVALFACSCSTGICVTSYLSCCDWDLKKWSRKAAGERVRPVQVPVVYHGEGTSSQVQKHKYHSCGILLYHWPCVYKCGFASVDIETSNLCTNIICISSSMILKSHVGVTKFRTTKNNSEGPLKLFTSISTRKNYPLYGDVIECWGDCNHFTSVWKIKKKCRDGMPKSIQTR